VGIHLGRGGRIRVNYYRRRDCPEDGETWIEKARILGEFGRWDDARASIEQARGKSGGLCAAGGLAAEERSSMESSFERGTALVPEPAAEMPTQRLDIAATSGLERRWNIFAAP
jgi:hypothetical protein